MIVSMTSYVRALLTRSLEALVYLVENGPSDPKAGICGNLADYLHSTGGADSERIRELLSEYWGLWPFFSGDPRHPIPGGFDGYRTSVGQATMWSGENRLIRYMLMRFLIRSISVDMYGLYTPPTVILAGVNRLLAEIEERGFPKDAGAVSGICVLVRPRWSEGTSDIVHDIGGLAASWSMFSGSKYYPVPGGEGLYDDAHWHNWRGELLEYRVSLLNHLRDKLMELLG